MTRSSHNLIGGEAFRALPTPATLVDRQGIIVDVNDAFLEYARSLGQSIQRESRVGHSIVDFASVENRVPLAALLESARTGRSSGYDIVHTLSEGGQRHFHIVGRPLRDAQGIVNGVLIVREDVTADVQREARRQLLFKLHGEVWRMHSTSDLEPVLVAVRDGLRRLDLPFEDCGVNLIDDRQDPAHVSFHNMTRDGDWISAGSDAGARIILDIWRGGTTVYRRDLDRDDPYGEAHDIESVFSHHVRGVVDVPFRQGTFAVNSARPNAFDAADIELIEEVAQVLGDGFSRLADFHALESRNVALERTMAGRRRAESALGESERRYQDVVENLPIGVAHTAADGRILYLNPHARRTLGYAEEDLSSVSVKDFYVHPRDRDDLIKALAEHGEYAYEHQFRRRDGRVLWMRGRTHVVRDESGEILYYQGFAEDVTEQHRLAAESGALHGLRDEVWRMQTVTDIERVITAVRVCLEALEIDADGCSIHVIDDNQDPPTVTSYRNRRGETTWERSVSEAARDTILTMWRAGEPTYRDDLLAADVQGEAGAIASRYGAAIRSVLDVPFSRGTLGINNVRPRAFSEEDIRGVTEITRILSSGFVRMADIQQLERHNQQLQREIAERRDLETQLQRSQKMEAVGQLTAGLAHNFNNILQAIVGNLELARRSDGADLSPMLRDAESAAHRAGDIIRQMLVFSRRDARQELRSVDLAELLQQTVSICQRTFDRRIELDLSLQPSLPWVLGDPSQLEQVLLNLLINARDAVRATDDPAVTIIAESRHLDSHQLARPDAVVGEYVAISVRDNGVGIAAEDLGRLFDPFFTTKAVGEGTGLGLFSAYGIIDGLGGWIECDSRQGEGAAFTVVLPEAREPAAEQATVEAEPTAPASGTILVIDDEETVLVTVSRMLRALGYQAITAGDGPSGLELLAAARASVDLVLLDLSMPRMSGAEVYRRIREQDAKLPVLILTGFASADQTPAGPAVVQKPFTLHALAQSVQEALSAGGGSRRPGETT